MSKKIRMDSYILTCRYCKQEYDLELLSLECKKKRQSNMYCPHCGQKLGRVS